MSGEAAMQGYELVENNHERLNDIENEMARLRHMTERIGKEKRACVAGGIPSFIMLDVIAAALWVIAIALVCHIVFKVG